MSSTPSTPSSSRVLTGSHGLLLAVLFVMMGNGIMNPLLGLRAELEGFSTTTTGIVLSFFYIGLLAGAWVTRRMVVDVGHIRVYAALASLASTSTLLYILNTNPGVWSLARLINGFAIGGLGIVGESWLNEIANNRTRGRLLSIYFVVLMGGLSSGQMLILFGDPSGFALFVAASILLSIAVIPITLAPSAAPTLIVHDKLPFGQVWRAAPLGVLVSFGQGIGSGALVTMGAVFAVQSGMSADRVAWFTSIALIGSVVLQPPIGILSDRLGRRRLIIATGLICAAACLVMINTDPLGWSALLVSFVVGGFSLSMYPLALSHINDRVPPGSAVGVSSMVARLAGVGSVLGPLAGGPVMASGGPEALYWLIGLVFLIMALLGLVRIFAREGVPAGRRRPFVAIPTRASGVLVHMARRIRPQAGLGKRNRSEDQPKEEAD
ncbi:MAG: MFS transporter [Acidimicrobiia bacterium]|nr:MFS transporter [Acidimicrobiia bacterium]MYF25980.1 MFS transporter [Acidimicrobiia bacterium]